MKSKVLGAALGLGLATGAMANENFHISTPGYTCEAKGVNVTRDIVSNLIDEVIRTFQNLPKTSEINGGDVFSIGPNGSSINLRNGLSGGIDELGNIRFFSMNPSLGIAGRCEKNQP